MVALSGGLEVFSCGVGFTNPTPNIIKSQINKKYIIVYFILLLFLLALGVVFGDPTPHRPRRPNTTFKEAKHHIQENLMLHPTP